MIFDFKNIPQSNYMEITQRNPIRWMLLEKFGEGFVNTTNFFKCRDFFNDFVYFIHTQKNFRVYNMYSNSVHPDEHGGVHVLVTGCTEHFAKNVEQAVNPEMKAGFGDEVTLSKIPDEMVYQQIWAPFSYKGSYVGTYLLYIPSTFWKSTFRISFLTLLLRNANIEAALSSYDDMLTPAFRDDGSLSIKCLSYLKDKKYLFPEQEQYIWYANSEYNSQNKYAGHDTIHNNGIMNFLHALDDNLYDDDEYFERDDYYDDEEESNNAL